MAAQACAGNFVAGASLGPTCLVPKAPFKDMDFGYYLRMVNAVYAIDDFPGDALLVLVQSLNLGPIWQASDSLSPRAPGSARRPLLKFAPEPSGRRLYPLHCMKKPPG